MAAEVNGRPVYTFRGNFAGLKMNPRLVMPNQQQLFLGVEGVFEVLIAEVRAGRWPPADRGRHAARPDDRGDDSGRRSRSSARRWPQSVALSDYILTATAFQGHAGNGRAAPGSASALAAPQRWQSQGTVWDFTYQWSGTAHTVRSSSIPPRRGHIRVHLQKDRVDVFPGGTWTSDWQRHNRASRSASSPRPRRLFPIAPLTPIRVTSRIGGNCCVLAAPQRRAGRHLPRRRLAAAQLKAADHRRELSRREPCVGHAALIIGPWTAA